MCCSVVVVSGFARSHKSLYCDICFISMQSTYWRCCYWHSNDRYYMVCLGCSAVLVVRCTVSGTEETRSRLFAEPHTKALDRQPDFLSQPHSGFHALSMLLERWQVMQAQVCLGAWLLLFPSLPSSPQGQWQAWLCFSHLSSTAKIIIWSAIRHCPPLPPSLYLRLYFALL